MLGLYLAGIAPVLKRIPFSEWRARSGRATMHPATLLPTNCRKAAEFARAGPGIATCTGKHRGDVMLVSACHARIGSDYLERPLSVPPNFISNLLGEFSFEFQRLPK